MNLIEAKKILKKYNYLCEHQYDPNKSIGQNCFYETSEENYNIESIGRAAFDPEYKDIYIEIEINNSDIDDLTDDEKDIIISKLHEEFNDILDSWPSLNNQDFSVAPSNGLGWYKDEPGLYFNITIKSLANIEDFSNIAADEFYDIDIFKNEYKAIYDEIEDITMALVSVVPFTIAKLIK